MELTPSNPNKEDLYGDCEITINDGSSSSDNCNFNTKVSYLSGITCSSDTLRCKQNDLYKCNSEGDDYELVKRRLKNGIMGCIKKQRRMDWIGNIFFIH